MSTAGNSAAARPLIPSWIWRLDDFARTLLRVRKNRRDMHRLRGLSDWQLADIGLTRDDLHYAWDCPSSIGDPTLRLDELVHRRHRIEAAARRVA